MIRLLSHCSQLLRLLRLHIATLWPWHGRCSLWYATSPSCGCSHTVCHHPSCTQSQDITLRGTTVPDATLIAAGTSGTWALGSRTASGLRVPRYAFSK
jgi:hypothetical protein